MLALRHFYNDNDNTNNNYYYLCVLLNNYLLGSISALLNFSIFSKQFKVDLHTSVKSECRDNTVNSSDTTGAPLALRSHWSVL